MRRIILRICALLGALCVGLAAAEEEVDLLTVDHRLYELGYRDGACTGAMDEVMENALRNFQRANNLGVTGEPDAGTLLVLLSDSATSQGDYLARLARESAEAAALSEGAQGEEVLRLQRELERLDYLDGEANGTYDAATVEAVCRFQLANGLEVTGTAGSAVFTRLYAAGALDWNGFLRGCASAVGAEGEKVSLLQRWLDRKGYYDGAYTGRYGENTQRAVRQFQTDLGMEASGDADVDTCRALFGNVRALLADAAALRPGDAGAEELCQSLAALGYPAHEDFDMQTELALMQFQRANVLPATGTADAATMERLGAPDAVGRAGYVATGVEAAQAEDFPAQIARQALRLVGRESDFDDEFSLVQYVYLKCGVGVANRSQFAEVDAEALEIQPGDVVVLELAEGELCGVAAADGALIYRGGDGRILMRYPEMMDAASVRLYRLAAQ